LLAKKNFITEICFVKIIHIYDVFTILDLNVNSYFSVEGCTVRAL